MAVKEKLFNVIKVILCGFGLITAFYMIIELTYFLSVPNKIKPFRNEPWLTTSWALLVNMSLLSLFVIQHSLLASKSIKEAFEAYGLQAIYRSLYVITTAGILLFLTRKWKSTPDAILWEYNLNHRPIYWLYMSTHIITWLIIYVGNICTDVTELLGIKQIYYNIMSLPDPNLRKSAQLQRLNAHMRHPSFLAFSFIFWSYPVMSLDRLLLATILTLYMYIAWNTDERDYYYHKYQHDRKYFELERLHHH